MKQIVTIALISATTSVAVNAAPFMAVGDNAELFVTASTAVQSDSNLFVKPNNEQSDVAYSFTPGVDLVFGKAAATKGNVYYREEIRRYSDNTGQNTTLSTVGAKAAYSTGITKVDLNASYSQIAQNDAKTVAATGAINERYIVRREVSTLGAKGEYGVSEKTSLGLGVDYTKTNYARASYVDSDVWSLPVDVFFKASPKLDWSAGYTYTDSSLTGSAKDNSDHFFNIGARGEFTPKLNGQVKVGYNMLSLEGGQELSQLGVDSKLTFDYSAKTSYSLTVANGFDNAVTGESTKNLTFGLSAETQFADQLSGNAGVNYTRTKYALHTDDYTDFNLGLNYTYNSYVNFAATLAFRENTSDKSPANEYSQNVFSLTANIRY